MKIATKSQVHQFFVSESVRWLIANSRDTRALAVAFPREIHISNLLAWLFSPNEGHGLSDLAIKELLLMAWQEANNEGLAKLLMGKFDPARILGASFSNSITLREYSAENSSDRIDLVVIDQTHKLVIGVENKYGARQGPEQLARYHDTLSKQLKSADATNWNLVLILLDHDPTSVPDDERWIKLSYKWLTKFINGQLTLGALGNESAATLNQLANYLDDEGDVPYPALDTEMAASFIEDVAVRHHEVLEVMEAYRFNSVNKSVSSLLSGLQDPIAVEYFRHRKLWDFVLAWSERRALVSPLRQNFPSLQVDDYSHRQETYFAQGKWHEDLLFTSDDDKEWPLYVAIREKARVSEPCFTVTAALDLRQLDYDDEREAELRAWGLLMRKQYIDNPHRINRTTRFFNIARVEVKSVHEAVRHAQRLIRLLSKELPHFTSKLPK